MKKVGKEFRKSLSAILAAAMVVSSMPETSLVANAEEVDVQQEAVELGEYAEVGAGESTGITPEIKVVDGSDQEVENLTATATVKYNSTSKLVFVQNVKLTGTNGVIAENYEVELVGSEEADVVDKVETYRWTEESQPSEITVTVRKIASKLAVTKPDAVTPIYKPYDGNASKLTEKYAKELINRNTSVAPIENLNSIANGTTVVIQVPTGYAIDANATKIRPGSDTEDPANDYYYLTISNDTAITIAGVDYSTTVGKAGLAKDDVTVGFKVNSAENFTTWTSNEDTPINAKKGDKVTLKLGYADGIVANVEAKETTSKDAVTVTQDATNKKLFTYTVGTEPIALTITANNKVAVTFDKDDKGSGESPAWDNTKVTSVKYGTDLDKVTATLDDKAVITDSDNEKDMVYFAIESAETVTEVKIASTPEVTLEKYRDNVFGCKAKDIKAGALHVTTADAKQNDTTVSVNVGTGLKAYYSTTKESESGNNGIVDNGVSDGTYDWIEITGSSFNFKKGTDNNVYIKVVADDNKMISTSKINKNDADREEALITNKIYPVALTGTTVGDKTTYSAAFEATAEDLAAEYTFTKNPNYTIRIQAGSYSKAKDVRGDITDYIDTNTADIVLDGTDTNTESQSVTVRVKDGQKIKFKVEPTAPGKKDIKSVKLNGSDVDVVSDYYTFTGNKNISGKTIDVECSAIARKTLTLDVTTNSAAANLKKIKVFINKNEKITVNNQQVDNDDYGKADHTEGNYYVFDSFASDPTVAVYPGQDVEIVFETKDGYAVNAIEYTLDGVNYKASGNSFTYAAMKANQTLKITVDEDAAKLNKAEFTYDSKTATITPSGATSVTKDNVLTGMTMLPAAIPDNNYATFSVEATPGYEIESITVGGEEIELGTSDTPITSKTGIKVDFGKEEKTVDNVNKEVSKSGQTVAVVVKTKAQQNKNDKLFTIDSSAFNYNVTVNGETVTKNDAKVTVPNQTGVSSYKRGNTTYYDVEAETTDEIEFTVEVPATRVADIDNTTVCKAAVYLADSVTAGGKTTYTFKIIANKLTTVDKNNVKADTIILSNTPATPITVTATGVDVLYKDGTPVTSVDNGTEVYLVYKPYLTLYRVDTDELNNPANEKIAVSYTVDGSLYNGDNNKYDGYNVSKVTISSDIADNDAVTFKTENEKLGDYQVWAEVSGDDSLEGDFKNEETGIQTNATAKAGNTVKIFVKSDKSFAINPVELTDEQKKLYNVTVNSTTKALEVSLTSKAADTITIPVVVTETNGNKKSEIEIVNFTINVAPAKSTVTVEGVEDKGTIEILAGKKTELPITFAAGTPIALIDVQSGSAVKAALNDKGDKLIIDATAAKVDQTQAISIRYDSKSVFSFTAKVVAPELKVTATSANTGDTYVNLTMDPSLKLASADDAQAYYEVKVTPGTGTGTMPTGSKTGYYYIPLKDLGNDDDADTREYGAESFVIPVNTAGGAWNYTVDVKLVLSNATGIAVANSKNIAMTEMKTSAATVCAASEAVSLALATKDTYYEDNLSVKQLVKTVYTGQKVDIASVNYSDSASAVKEVAWEIVNSDGSQVIGGRGTSDTSDGFMDITVPNVPAGKYTVNVYAESETLKQIDKTTKESQNMIKSKASFTVNVKYGIRKIVLDNSDHNNNTTAATLSLAQTGAKDVSYTFKPVGYYFYYIEGYKDNKKSAIQKFTYKVETATAANKDNVSISAKGKLTVSKNYVFSANEAYNTAKVTITAADYEGNTKEQVVNVTIKNEKAEIDSIKLVKDGKDLGTALTYDQTLQGVDIQVKDKDGNNITNNVTITPVKGSAYVQDGKLYTLPNKAPKSVTLKATTKDGGKKSKSLKVTLGYNTEATLTAEVTNTNAVELTPNNWSVQTKGGLVYVDIYAGGSAANKSIYNWSVSSVKGGKVVSALGSNTGVVINPTSDKITFTLTDKTKKPVVKTTVTVAVTDYASTKAPKFSLNKGEKLYANVFGTQTLKYTVKSDEYNAVQITWLSGTKNTNDGITEKVYDIEDGQFELVSTGTTAKAGTHKYQAVFGYLDKGVFYPATKAANFSIKMSKQTKVTPVTEYTLSYLNTDRVEFAETTGAYTVTVNGVENDNVKGKSNNFATYFETVPGTKYIRLRSNISNVLKKFDDIASIPEEDLTGYVNYTYNTWNGSVTTSVKIKINLVSEAVNYSFASIPVVSNSTVYADVLATDDKGNYITIDTSKTPVSATAGWSVNKVENTIIDGKNVTKIQLRSTAATVGENEVSIKVVPENVIAGSYSSVSVDKNGINLVGKVIVLDAESVTGLLAFNTNATVDFNRFDDGLASQSYNDSTKKGTYTALVPLEDEIFYNIDKAGVIDWLSNGEKIANVTTTAKAKVSLTTIGSASFLKVVAEEADVTGMTKIPLTFTFNHAKTGQTVELAVVAPEIFDVNAMKSVIESELASYPYLTVGGDADATAKLDAILAKYAGSGIVRKAGLTSVADEDGLNYTLTGKINAKNSTSDDVEISVVMSTKTIHKEKYSAAIMNTILGTIKDESYKIAETEDPSRVYVVSKATTAYDLLSYINGRLEVYTTNSDEYTFKITGFKKEAPSNYVNGTIKFTVETYKDGKYITSTSVITKNTNYLKYKVDEE